MTRNSFLSILIFVTTFTHTMKFDILAVVPEKIEPMTIFFTAITQSAQLSYFKDSYGKEIRKLACLNKCTNRLVNDSKYTRLLITCFSRQLGRSNEVVATTLRTPTAKKIVEQQNKLFKVCTPAVCPLLYDYVNNTALEADATRQEILDFYAQRDMDMCLQLYQIEKLCKEGADLEFTYNKKYYPKHVTPFIALCLTPERPENSVGLGQLMRFFIGMHEKRLVNLERMNPEGRTGFMISSQYPETHWVGDYFL